MKGTNISRISTQNEGALEVLYNQTYQNVSVYISNTDDVMENKDTISAYSLYSILKDFYADLAGIMDAESEELKELVEAINAFISNGYQKVVSSKKSNKLMNGIESLLLKIKDSKQNEMMVKRYLGIRFYIRRDTTSAVLDVLEDNKYKKVILNRDLASDELYYGENSVEDYDVIDFAYDRLMDLFDLIDSYREYLPEQIDTDIALDDYACKPYEYATYSTPIASEMVTGEIFVNSNGYVDFDMNITRESNKYHYINSYSRSLKELIRERSTELLKKISVDVNTLEEPIKEIVVAAIANKRNLEKSAG